MISIIAYIFFPFISEIFIRVFQGILTFNYFAISFVIAAICFILFLSLPKLKKIWIWTYFFLFYIPTFIDVGHIYLFVGSIDSLALKAVFESNYSEISEFFCKFSNLKSILFFISLIFISVVLLKNALCVKFKIKLKYSQVVFILFPIGLIASCFVHDKYKPNLVKMIKCYGYYKNEKNFIAERIRQRSNFDYGKITSLVSGNERRTYVIVIGESANRDHLSLYGYTKKTTPLLDSMKKNLYFFDNVSSAHCQTLEVLQEALTFDSFSNGDVISFLKKARFKTFWISNQFNGGRWDNIIAMVGKQADVCYFINQKDTQPTRGECYDELLIPHFQKAINDPYPKKVIFVHLLGSHSVYANRYPKNFKIFENNEDKIKQTISEYDNSIAYTDFILHKFITMLQGKNENTLLLYFSDHGEDVRDSPDCVFFHSPSLATPSMFAIPFFVWISDKYFSENKEFIKRWNIHKEYKTNKLIHSMLRLFRLNNYKIDDNFSIFEP